MKHLKLFAILLAVTIIVAACAAPPTAAPPAPTAPAKETVVVKETVIVQPTAGPAVTPTGRFINIAAMLDLSGPIYAPVVRNAFRAMNDYIAEVNSKGGIDGVRVELLWGDHSLNIQRAQSIYKRFADTAPKPLFLQTAWSTENETLKDSFAKDLIPALGSGLSPKSVSPPGYIFLILPDYASQFAFFLDYVKANWKDTTRAPKIAFITWQGAYGEGMLNDLSRAYAKKLGIDIAEPVFISPVAIDTTAQLQQIAALKPDYVWSNTLPTGFAVVLKDAKRLGLNLQFAGVQWLTLEEIFANAGDTVDGMLAVRTFSLGQETNLPGVKAMQDAQVKYHGAYDPYSFNTYALGWLGSQIGLDAVRAAMKKVGYEKLDGKAVYDELVNLKDYSTGGLARPITFGATERRGTLEARIVKAVWDTTTKTGSWKAQTDWGKVPDMLPK
ncbi:MAG: ABC transporter substrate-binding protein [Chloroflexi bacterium]|nr:ABC transporter substrate-binding protein [Chloroflexota bacterium]